MPLTSFAEAPQAPAAPERDLAFRMGTPDVGEAAGVAVQFMHELGLGGPDRDRELEEVTTDFTTLAKAGYDGRLHVLPSELVTFDHTLTTAEQRRGNVAERFIYPNLWTPGTEENSYTEAELNAGPKKHVARLAVSSNLNTGYDPVLHDLNKPYDSYKDKKIDVNPGGLPTQVEELEADIVAFEARHPSLTLSDVEQKAFAVLAGMDRIRGTDTKDQILSKGFMRIRSLGRRAVGGGSVVGGVDSCVGQLYFGGGHGGAHAYVGVGRSMGLRELEPQAS